MANERTMSLTRPHERSQFINTVRERQRHDDFQNKNEKSWVENGSVRYCQPETRRKFINSLELRLMGKDNVTRRRVTISSLLPSTSSQTSPSPSINRPGLLQSRALSRGGVLANRIWPGQPNRRQIITPSVKYFSVQLIL
ncbi:hypothetical protein TREMEDRAFT_58638 [Tremella mesenterica DSM 1558]|uniref:uncharacterized protein n=1 Tax=Tremella mesenterica (strain ATCC 24925 / CBS 8224 / DSM 1558 / NBRC 9311 / NRRL Y-6157 / RJB 2259-6 / UBC 559-6) TaxID=578456 RepID=UPI0003F497C4|nr:uncharacterized protein TREMEDRAFT_58638 [Tremella mesenterica DSM 1558]EIW72469.1 hypothetical protein TREMEDRAFT_58638 [Tremella mesenterica DSM 1558]